MAIWLKQSTSRDIGIGPFVDNIDGFTAKTALTLTQPDIRLKKNSGNWAQKNAAQTLPHEENGWYELTLDDTDTNTLGILLVSVQESGALPVQHEFQILPANIYNAMIDNTDIINSRVQEMINNVITSGSVATSAVTEIVNGVWDELLTGATHNIATSAGRRLRTQTDSTLDDGTAQSGTANSITLATSASTTVGIYVGCLITISAGTGAGQSRYIVGYTAGRVASVARSWTVAPNNTSVYSVYGDNQILFTILGLAQAGGATSITLQSDASATNNLYVGQAIRVMAGPGDDQVRLITAYNGTTKVATVDRPWIIIPDGTCYYGLLMFGESIVGMMADEVVTAAAIATDAIGASELAASASQEIADAMLTRDMGAVSGEAARSLLNAIRKLMNKWSISGTVLTVTKEDDLTTAFTQTITPAPGADPISGLNTD